LGTLDRLITVFGRLLCPTSIGSQTDRDRAADIELANLIVPHVG
jgi:hypothetical protein